VSQAKQIKEVAGHLNAAGHDLERARKAAKRISEKDGHALAQLEAAAKLNAEAWWNRFKAMSPDV
jgi:hypothetical protein